jgi:hypothetical protein
MKRICVITNGYPTKDDPTYAFIRPVVEGFADHGVECTVIAPQSVTGSVLKGKKSRPEMWMDTTKGGNQIKIFQPKFLSLSNIRVFGIHLSTFLRDLAIQKCFKKNKISADVLYGHFWDCGIAVAKISNKNTISHVFVATG